MRHLSGLLIIAVSWFAKSAYAQSELPRHTTDSLWAVWNNPRLHDTLRLRAAETLAWEAYQYTSPDSALSVCQLQYDLAKKTGNRAVMADALRTRGSVLNGKGDLDGAIRSFTECINIRREVGDKAGEGKAHNNLGMAYHDHGHLTEAAKHYELALGIFHALGNKDYEAGALNNLGTFHFEQGNFPVAIEIFTRSLRLREESGHKKGMASCLTNIGNIYYWQNKLDKALEYYAKAVKAAREAGDTRSVSNGIGNQGNIYADMGDYPRALAMLKQSMAIDSATNDRQGLAMSLNSIGSIYSDMGNLDSARVCFEHSMAIREAINDRLGLGAVWNNMGEYHRLRKEYPKAVEYGKKALSMARELGNVGLQKDAANMLYETYLGSGDHRQALEMFQLYRLMTDSLENVESQQEVMRQQFQYDFDKKEALLAAEQEKKDAISAEQLKRRSQQRNALMVGVALTLGLAGVSYRSYLVKQRANQVITAQKQAVEEKNHAILESIAYARRLQEAVLPPTGALGGICPDSFLLYLPRDVVSGDFHWTHRSGNLIWLAVGDCTGHGVPGAMLSVMGLNSLNRCVADMGLSRPKDVLQQMTLDQLVAFGSSAQTVRDGMDMALCCIDTSTMTLTYAGANNPLLIVRDGEAHLLKPARRPIGHHDADVPFTQEEFALRTGDCIYMMSDGFQDQQGGAEGRKYFTKRLRDLIVTIADRPMADQGSFLRHEFDRWRGSYEQTDDVCVMGVRVHS